ERSLPVALIEQDHVFAARWMILVGAEEPSEARPNAQQREEVPRYAAQLNEVRIEPLANGRLRTGIDGEILEVMRRRTKVGVRHEADHTLGRLAEARIRLGRVDGDHT